MEYSPPAFERDLQKLIERNMEVALGITFLKSEHFTGKEHKGRIDSLGIDENYCPVIIEYKRSRDQSILAQGLFYLRWLSDHKADFKLLVTEKFGREYASKIEWTAPRVLCIANDFSRYDKVAVEEINRNIELIRYKKYKDILLLEHNLLSEHVGVDNQVSKQFPENKARTQTKTYKEVFNQMDKRLQDLHLITTDFIKNLGDDVQEKELKYYVAFKRIRNFSSLEIRHKVECLVFYLSLNPDKVDLSNNLIRDVRNVGHCGTGDLEVKISSVDDFEQTKYLFIRSYEQS